MKIIFFLLYASIINADNFGEYFQIFIHNCNQSLSNVTPPSSVENEWILSRVSSRLKMTYSLADPVERKVREYSDRSLT